MSYNKIEKSEAKRIGATAHKNSGRGMKKADASDDQFVIDFKFVKKSFTINKNVWSKIVTDALSVDHSKSPVIMVVMGEDVEVRLAIIEWSDFELLKEGYKNGKDNN